MKISSKNPPMTLLRLREALQSHRDPEKGKRVRIFFKNCTDDVFLGASAKDIHKLAKDFSQLSFPELLQLMQSNVHEERSVAHSILCLQFLKADEEKKRAIFDFYLKHRRTIRDWDGVDNSAPYIVGAFLLHREKKILYDLAQSSHLWDRRIAIVSTWWFIRHHHFIDTLQIAELLLQDKEDLIHKATGWMLRELGKRDRASLVHFLDTHYQGMPRTMLRYALEKFSKSERAHYLERVVK